MQNEVCEKIDFEKFIDNVGCPKGSGGFFIYFRIIKARKGLSQHVKSLAAGQLYYIPA